MVSQPAAGAGPDAPRPAARYGDPTPARARRRRRAVVAGAVALGVVLAGFAAWVGVASGDDVAISPRGYEHVGDGVLRVTFAVTRTGGGALVCEVEALSSGSARVGLVSVPVPASEQPTVVVTADVLTSERAVTGRAVACVPA